MTASSTKALFRATKPKADRAPQPALMPLHDQTAGPDLRRAMDLYPTHEPEPIRALFARDGDRIAALGSVWEPAAGRGDMVAEIEAQGLSVIATDIADHGCPRVHLRNFFDWGSAAAPAIITNPPYDQINARDGHGRWLKHTLAMPGWRYCALLLSWDWPAARANGLGAVLDATPFSWCYLMRWKIDFTGAGSPPQRNAWFVWDRDDPRATDGSLSDPSFRWLDRTDARQGSLAL